MTSMDEIARQWSAGDITMPMVCRLVRDAICEDVDVQLDALDAAIRTVVIDDLKELAAADSHENVTFFDPMTAETVERFYRQRGAARRWLQRQAEQRRTR